MKVCLIGLHFAEYTLSLALSLASQCRLLVILSEPNALAELGVTRLRNLAAEGRIELVLLPHSRSIPLVFTNVASILRAVRTFGPDIVHLQEEPKDYQALAMPLLKGFPLVLTVHDPAPHSGLDAKRVRMSRRRAYLRMGRDLADSIIVHGHSLVGQLSRRTHRDKAIVIPHGPLGLLVPQMEYQPCPGELLFFGRIEAYKGLEHFIEAVKIVRSWGVEVKGVVAGRGSELEKYRNALENDGAFQLIEGFLTPEEAIERFDRAQIVILPYKEGTQSGVAACAAGRGRPVIASNVGSLAEMVIHEKTGIIVPPRSSLELAKAIVRLVKNRSLSDQMGVYSRNLAQKRAEEVRHLTYQTYSALIEKRAETL